MDELVTRIRRGLGANTDANAAFDELMALAGDRMEALVEAIAAERRVRREGHWTEMHMTAVDLASLALELVLVDTECACSCHFHLPPEIRAKSECLACGCGPALGVASVRRNLTHCCECDRELLDGPVLNWDDYFDDIELAAFACGPCAKREGFDAAE